MVRRYRRDVEGNVSGPTEIPSQHFTGETEVKREERQSGYSVFWPRLELNTSGTELRGVTV
jgi:hypothetical protein